MRRCTSKDAGLRRGPTSIGERNECQRGCWAVKEVDCETPHRLGGERNTLYKGVEPLPSRRVLKTLRVSPKGKSPKRTISASGGWLRPLQLKEGMLTDCSSR